LGIAAASLVLLEPQLPTRAYRQLEGLAGRLDAYVQVRHEGYGDTEGIASIWERPPDSYCMKRGALRL
jgi:hypothetical protein